MSYETNSLFVPREQPIGCMTVPHRVRVRADHFSYPTAAGNAAPCRPQPVPGIQWPSFAAGMRCRGAARVARCCHCVPLG
jgi:hypothetical protein